MRTISVGTEPTGVAANPKRNEIYVVNAGSSNVSVIDAEQNKVVATIGVHGRPYFVDVAPDGHRAYVANSGSANVSVLDLDHRTVAATIRVGAAPGLARVSPDGSTVVVTKRRQHCLLIDTARLTVLGHCRLHGRKTSRSCRLDESVVSCSVPVNWPALI